MTPKVRPDDDDDEFGRPNKKKKKKGKSCLRDTTYVIARALFIQGSCVPKKSKKRRHLYRPGDSVGMES